MGYKKPKKELGKFLKDKKNTFAKSKLLRLNLAVGTAVIGMNFVFNGAVIAAHNNLNETHASFEQVPGVPTCVRLVPTHSQHNQHINHSNHSNHGSY